MSSYKTGVVTQLDPATCRARVQFDDHESIESYWLPVVQRKTQADKDYHMPDVGEHVSCLLDEHGEDGVVVGAIYSDADTAPVDSPDKRHVAFKDGAVFEYDRDKHRLTVSLPGAQIRATVGQQLYLEVKGEAVIILHDAADVDCRKRLRLRAKEGIEQWTPSVVQRPYAEASIPPVEDA